MLKGNQVLLPFARMRAIRDLGDVSTAKLSTALDASASTNSGPIWKHMGEPLADVLLANALETCDLAHVTTTRAVIGLFLACPHLFPSNLGSRQKTDNTAR